MKKGLNSRSFGLTCFVYGIENPTQNNITSEDKVFRPY